MNRDYKRNKETGKCEYTKEGIKARTKYNKAIYSCITFMMKPEDYERYSAAAEKAGMKFASWVRLACEKMMER